jgi:hypothetical protein
MGKRYYTAKSDISSVVDLLFYPDHWYGLGEIRDLCRKLDVYYLDDTTRSRLDELVHEGKLMRRTFGGDYQWSLPLKQLPLPDTD